MIQDGVEVVGNSAFLQTVMGSSNWRAWSYGIQYVELPNTLKEIGSYAFAGQSKLQTITIPSEVISIGWRAFAANSSLEEVTIDSTFVAANLSEEDSQGDLLEHAQTVYIKSDITQIGEYITSNFTKQATSDKPGYDKYVRNE